MSWINQRTAAGLLAVTLTGAGLGWLCRPAPAEEKALPKPAVADKEVEGWVAKRVQAWQPTREERRFDVIAWAKDIRQAERLAKKHGRPVFLFTHDGRMNIGRC
jgi:hypothetical protein